MSGGEEASGRPAHIISLRHAVGFVVFGVVVYLVMVWLGQYDLVVAALAALPWWVVPAMVLLSFMNYVIRYFKWQYYLHRIGVHYSHSDSFTVFLAGFVLTATPGKIGEAIKGYFCNELDSTPIAKTAPVVVAERVTDLLAMVLLAVLGFLVGMTGGNELLLLGFVGALGVGAAVLLGNPAFYQRVLHRVTGAGPFARFRDSMDLVEDTLVRTLSPRPLLLMVALSIPGWSMECLELWLLLSLLTGAGLPSLTVPSLVLLAQAVFVHAAASTVGAVLVFLPGGLGGYEAFAVGVMTALLMLPLAVASAATILIRFVTLWFSVVVGGVAATVLSRRRRRRAPLV